MLIDIAEISFKMLKHGITIIDEKHINVKRYDDVVVQTGFFSRYETEEKGRKYQFRHLVLQEYLAALYVFLYNERSDIFEHSKLRDALPIVAGLDGIYQNAGNKDTSPYVFVRNIYKEYSKLHVFKWFFQHRQHVIGELARRFMSDFTRLTFSDEAKIDCGTFLSALFEYRGDLPNSVKMDHKFTLIKTAPFTNLYHHQLLWLSHFFTCLRTDNILCKSIELSMVDGDITGPEIQKMKKYFARTKYLSVSKTKITAHDWKDLMDQLKMEKVVKHLQFKECQLDEEHIESLCLYIPSLESLELINNPLKTESVRKMADILKDCTQLKKLDLSNCNMTEQCLPMLSISLYSIEKLILSGNINMKGSIKIFSNVLSEDNCKLKELNLSNCDLDDDDIRTLNHLHVLKKLVLNGNNKITFESITYICQELSKETSYTDRSLEVNLFFCEIKKPGTDINIVLKLD